MKRSTGIISFYIIIGLAFVSTNASASGVPIRRPSDNGTYDTAQYWNLVTSMAPITLTSGTKSVVVTRQIVCTNYDVVDSEYPSDKLNSGGCKLGGYGFLFQLRSTSANVTVSISNLIGFTADANLRSYGVQICDDHGNVNANTLALCTTATSGQIPNITFSTNQSSTEATFLIPSFPGFPAGIDREGQGLTLYVQTQQTSPIPIGFPTISIR